MKYLNYYLLFNEAKQEPKEIIEKYYSDIDLDTLSKLILADPTSIIIDNKIKKIGSYVKFLVKIYRNKSLLLEDLPRAKNYLELFIANKSKLPNIDILKFNKLSDLGKIVRPYLDLESGELTPLMKDLDNKSYKLLFDGDNWRVYQPLTEKASCVLGYGTEWCTTWGKYSLNKNYRSRTNQFNKYKDNLLVLVNQDTDKPEWQLHLRTNQFNDVHDINRSNSLSSFLEENTELCPVIFPQLTDLDDKNNLSNILKYYNYLPDYYHSVIQKEYSSLIPENIFDLITKIETDKNPEEYFLDLFNIKDKEKYEDSISIAIGGSQYYKGVGEIKLNPDFYKSQIRSYYDLTSYLSWISNGGADGFNNNYAADDVNLEDYIPEKIIFGKGLYEDINKLGLNITNFEELKDYLGSDKVIDKITEMFREDYNYQYNDEITSFAENIASSVRDCIEIEAGADVISMQLYTFLIAVKALFIETNDDEYKLKLDDVIEKIFSYNDIPDSFDEFQTKVYNDFDFNFDYTDILHEIQVKIYDVVSDKEDQLEEEEKEANKTDEERQKEIDELKNRKKNTIQEFNQLLPKLGFLRYKEHWQFDNEEYEITFFTDDFNDNGDSIFIKLYNKITKKETKGYITPENLNSQFNRHVLKITERIKKWSSFNQ